MATSLATFEGLRWRLDRLWQQQGLAACASFLCRPRVDWLLCAVTLALSVGQAVVHGQAPSLRERIDRHASSAPDWLTASPLPDSQSLRRLSLDLRNVAPTAAELDAFASEPAEGRWERWVDRFLNDPLHRERIVDWLDKSLMQRRPYQHVDRATWLAYLRRSVDARTPLDQWMREWIASAWWNRTQRAEQRFYLDRGGDPHAIARDLGRVLFGKDMQCAQCHDHPQIEDYLQIDYHGLLAFVSPGALAEGKTTDDKGAEQKLQMYIEKPAGDAPFESVFNKGVAFRTATRLPGGLEKLEPYLAPDARLQPQPIADAFGGMPSPPVASRRALLAAQLTSEQRAFAENWANRIWAMMFGRGLVHPLDMQQFDNPASNPELLSELTDALVASKFDVDAIVREIACSQLYRRGRNIPLEQFADASGVLRVTGTPVAQWGAQVAAWIERETAAESTAEQSVSAAHTNMESAADAWRAVQKERVALRAELDAQENVFADTHKKFNEAAAAANTALANRNALQQKIGLLVDAATKLEQAKALGDDAEIASAMAAMRAKADAIKPQLEPLEQALKAAEMVRDTAHQTREVERGKWQAIVDRLQPIEQRLTQSDAAFVAARTDHQRARRQSAWHRQRIEQYRRLQHWIESSRGLEPLEESRASLAAQKQAMEPKLTALSTELDAATAQLAIHQSEAKAADEKRAQVEAQRAALIAQIDRLKLAKQGLVDSTELLSEGAAVGAIQAIDQSLAMRATQMEAMQAELQAVVSQQSAIATRLEGMQQAKRSKEDAIAEVRTEMASFETKRSELADQATKLREECGLLRDEVMRDLESQSTIAAERALSPEQFAWSLLMVTGQFPYYVKISGDELDKQSPLAADASAEALAARALQSTRLAMDKLQGSVDGIVALYSSGVGQTADEFFASPDQALYVANGGAVYSWSAPNGSNVASKMVQVADGADRSKTLCWDLLAREPTPSEREWIAQEFSNATPEAKPAIAHELVWGVLAGVEFRLYP